MNMDSVERQMKKSAAKMADTTGTTDHRLTQ
jgi:hypothetical protein